MMYKAIPITDSCESCYMIIDEKGGAICSDVVSKEYAERIAKALNRDEVFENMAEFVRGIDLSWGMGDVRFTSLGGWNRAVDKLESILAKIDALEGEVSDGLEARNYERP